MQLLKFALALATLLSTTMEMFGQDPTAQKVQPDVSNSFYWPTGSADRTAQNFVELIASGRFTGGTWLGPDHNRYRKDESGDPVHGITLGAYSASEFHLGFDIMNNVSDDVDPRHPVYAIADGQVVVLTHGTNKNEQDNNSWGNTACSEIEDASLNLSEQWPSGCISLNYPTDQNARSGNAVLVIRHQLASGATFYAVYGHLIDANQRPRNLPSGSSANSNLAIEKNGRRPFQNGDVFLAGELIGYTGDWGYGRHLHFGISPYPIFKSMGLAGYDKNSSTDWPITGIDPSDCTNYPSNCLPTGFFKGQSELGEPMYGANLSSQKSGMSDAQFSLINSQINPIDFITNPANLANNWISAAGASTTAPNVQTTTPTANVSVVPGQVVAVPAQAQSSNGFVGPVQGSTHVLSGNPENSEAITIASDGPAVLADGLTIDTQSVVYIPGTVSSGSTYILEVSHVFQDSQGNIGSSVPQYVTLQVADGSSQGQGLTQTKRLTKKPSAVHGMDDPQPTPPAITALGATSGLVAGSNLTIYVVGTGIDPSSVQATLTGTGCPSGVCAATAGDVTSSSYVGTFTGANAPAQDGTYQLYLQNGSGAGPSNGYPVTVYPALAASCSPGADSTPVNADVTFTASASGGLPPYSFSWENGAAVGSGSPITARYASGGFLAANDVYASDQLGNQVRATCGLTVQAGTPAIVSLSFGGSALVSGSPFSGVLAGANFDPSSFQLWFCAPDESVCVQQPPSGVTAYSGMDGSTAQLAAVSLPAGTWVAKVRNGSGPWSNASPSFAVAAPPVVPAPGTCSPSAGQVGDVSFANVALDPSSTPTVSVFDFTFTSGSAHAMADTHAYFYGAGCPPRVDYLFSPAVSFAAGQNTVRVAYDAAAGTTWASANGAATAPQYVGVGLASVMVHASDNVANAGTSPDFLIPQPPPTPIPAAPELYQTSLFGDPSLSAYWRMEGGAADSTANANAGSAASVSFGTQYGIFGQGAALDGSSSSIRVPDAASLDPTASLTVSLWVRPTGAGSQYEVYLAKSDPGDAGGSTSYALGLLSGDGYIFGHVRAVSGGGYLASSVTRAAIAGAWTHLALTYDGSCVRLYVNGAEAAAPLAASGPIMVAAGDLLLGSENAIAGTLLQGSLDDVSIFGRALTAAEVLHLYSGN